VNGPEDVTMRVWERGSGENAGVRHRSLRGSRAGVLLDARNAAWSFTCAARSASALVGKTDTTSYMAAARCGSVAESGRKITIAKGRMPAHETSQSLAHQRVAFFGALLIRLWLGTLRYRYRS